MAKDAFEMAAMGLGGPAQAVTVGTHQNPLVGSESPADIAALQNLVDAGGRVYVSGTFAFSGQTLQVTQNDVEIISKGTPAVFDGGLDTVTCNGNIKVSLRGLHIRNPVRSGIYIKECDEATVKECTISGIQGLFFDAVGILVQAGTPANRARVHIVNSDIDCNGLANPLALINCGVYAGSPPFGGLSPVNVDMLVQENTIHNCHWAAFMMNESDGKFVLKENTLKAYGTVPPLPDPLPAWFPFPAAVVPSFFTGAGIWFRSDSVGFERYEVKGNKMILDDCFFAGGLGVFAAPNSPVGLFKENNIKLTGCYFSAVLFHGNVCDQNISGNDISGTMVSVITLSPEAYGKSAANTFLSNDISGVTLLEPFRASAIGNAVKGHAVFNAGAEDNKVVFENVASGDLIIVDQGIGNTVEGTP